MSVKYETAYSAGKRVLLIVNPKAGHGIAEPRVKYLEHMLKKYGFSPEL